MKRTRMTLSIRVGREVALVHEWISDLPTALRPVFVSVMSDHGNRFDQIRRTLIGRYEERMPYLSVYLPPWFKKRYPNAAENLETNVWRLSCQYDVYETLVDVVNGRYGDEARETFKTRGRSLFSRIPKTRTCSEAQISPHFCVCQKEESLDIRWPIVRMASEYALEKITSHYLGGANVRGLCARLRLKSIVSAQKYKASDNVRYAIRWHYNKLLSERNVTAVVSHLRVTFSTAPNEGVYEALVQYYEASSGGNGGETDLFNATSADISRINPYGHDGDCVSKIDRTLEKFCYCKKGIWFL